MRVFWGDQEKCIILFFWNVGQVDVFFFFKLSTEKIPNERFGADFVRETHEDTPLARPTATVMPMPLAGVVLPVEVKGMGKAGSGSCLPSLQS